MAAIVASRFAALGGGTLAAGARGGATHPPAFALATRNAYLVMAAVAVAAAGLSLRQTGGARRGTGNRPRPRRRGSARNMWGTRFAKTTFSLAPPAHR